jgi:hypothetical protein
MAVTDDQVAALRAWLRAGTGAEASDAERFVAGFRSSTAEAAELLSPSAAENQLRGVLGDKQAIVPIEEERARAQFLLLPALTVTLGPPQLDQVLAEGRALADALIMES